jgi:hypothetical protein
MSLTKLKMHQLSHRQRNRRRKRSPSKLLGNLHNQQFQSHRL